MRSISKKAKTFVSIATIAYGLILLYVLFFRSIGVTYPWGYIEYLKAMHNFIPFRSMYVLLTTPVISGQVIIRSGDYPLYSKLLWKCYFIYPLGIFAPSLL